MGELPAGQVEPAVLRLINAGSSKQGGAEHEKRMDRTICRTDTAAAAADESWRRRRGGMDRKAGGYVAIGLCGFDEP